ncbi:MAG: adenylyl-sulfate kinase [Phycisphaerae bacterium]|nr:adenylyl-sulfate kinase [Phycisphaerae bacterium]
MSEQRSENVVWHGGEIGRADRAERLGQRGATIWFTGLSGSGKSTLAVSVEHALHQSGRHAYRLDGDNVRHGLNGDLGFGPEDRDENIRRVGEVSALMADSGLLVLSSFISPFRAERSRVRALHEAAGLPFLEIFVDVPLDVAESRDPKGLYKKARAGEISDFTGIHQPYEPPEAPELRLPTSELSLQESTAKVIDVLRQRGLIPS